MIGVKTVRVPSGTAVPEEEHLRCTLSSEVLAVLVALGRGSGRRYPNCEDNHST